MSKAETRYIIETLIGTEWVQTSRATSKETAIKTCKDALLCDAWTQREHIVKEHCAFRVKDIKTDCIMYNTDRDEQIRKQWSEIAYGGTLGNAMKYGY